MIRKMKDSGIEWIGEIPEDWEVVRISSVVKERSDKVSSIDYEPLSVTKQGVVLQLEGVAKSNNPNDRKKVIKGDFVINSRSDRKQSCGIAPVDGSVSLINIILELKRISPEYTKYLLDNYGFAEEFYRWGTGIVDDLWSTNYEKMKRIIIPLPPQSQQQAIADFLDEKTQEIDNVISKTKKAIEEYKKYKQSLITETVTKGLDENVEMKDSGIEWIGDIPEHWDIVRLKYLVNCNEQTLSSSTSDDYKFRYIDIGSVDFHKGIIGYEEMKYKDSPSRARRIVKEGDLIVSTVRTYLRAIATIEDDEDVIVSTGFAVLTPKKVKEKYLEYLTKTEYFISEVIKNSVGVSYPAINSKELLEIKISFPPLKEQEQIASYLDEKTNQIDQIISSKQKLIIEMEAYKKSLIYETVTGKREVE